MSIGAIILAAGKGTRMKSGTAKVLHELFYQPMLLHVLDTVLAAKIPRPIVVIGHQKEEVAALLSGRPVELVEQAEQLGTGHAVRCAREACAGLSQVFILYGDTPLIRPDILSSMLLMHQQSRPAVTLMTTRVDRPAGYGRVIRGAKGGVRSVVEDKDATPEQRRVNEINTGIYIVETAFLFEALNQLGTDNSQGELYLTDIVALARNEGLDVQPFFHPRYQDVLGVNSRVDLARAESALQMRRNEALMTGGVTMLHPESTRVAPGCSIGRDSILHGGVSIEEDCILGHHCVIEQGVVLRNCMLGANARIGANSVLVGCKLGEGESLPPLTRMP